MNLLGFLPDVLKTIGSITGIDIIKKAGEALGDGGEVSKLPPETQLALQTALQKHEETMRGFDVEELKAVVQESVGEISSSDKFTSRARPMGVYCATAITTLMAIGVFICMVNGKPIDLGAIGAITSLIVPMWGYGAWYTTNRTKEKMAAATKGGAQ
jgi:hypothetical protein